MNDDAPGEPTPPAGAADEPAPTDDAASPDGPAGRAGPPPRTPRPPAGRSARPVRKVPRRALPTTVQLGRRPTVLLLRGLVQRCPACGGGHVFRRWFVMTDRCGTCTLRFERVEGHWIGSLGLNTTVVFGVMLVVLLAVTIGGYPDPPIVPMLLAEIVIALMGPLAFFPSSRTLWTAMDLLMRPLLPGEIDPRFVEVDPYRDRPPRAR